MFYLINRTFTKNNSMYEVICVDEGSNPSWSTIYLFVYCYGYRQCN